MEQSLALSIEEVQKISGLGRTKVYQLINSGSLIARKSGKRTLILRSDLEAFLTNLPSYASPNTNTQGAL